MILLQGVDAYELYEKTSCFEGKEECEVGISSSYQTIPTEVISKVEIYTFTKRIDDLSALYPYLAFSWYICIMYFYSTSVLVERSPISKLESVLMMKSKKEDAIMSVANTTVILTHPLKCLLPMNFRDGGSCHSG